MEKTKEFIYGVTVDRINDLDITVSALKRLPKRPTTRIVFDEHINPDIYSAAVDKIGLVSDVMGELLDSYYVKEYSIAEYKKRAEQYLNAFADKVSIWEVGNEINGEWLLNSGEKRSVVAEKVAGAYDVAKSHLGKTAITLYYNPDCWAKPEHEMFRWAQNELPDRVKKGVDYVFVSYYEEDCNNHKPNWQAVFEKLQAAFPNSKLGFGEVGSKKDKENYLRRYYNTKPQVKNFVGGYFWWYFWQDMVQPLKKGDTHMIDVLGDVIKKS